MILTPPQEQAVLAIITGQDAPRWMYEQFQQVVRQLRERRGVRAEIDAAIAKSNGGDAA